MTTTLRRAIDQVYGDITPDMLTFHALNTSPVPLTRGMPIRIQSADGSIKRGRAMGSFDVIRRVVGLLADDEVAIGASGNVRMGGLVTASKAQWDAITGQSGGLTPGMLYYLSAEFGMLSSTPPDPAAYPGAWIVEMGIAQSATAFMVRIQTIAQQ